MSALDECPNDSVDIARAHEGFIALDIDNELMLELFRDLCDPNRSTLMSGIGMVRYLGLHEALPQSLQSQWRRVPRLRAWPDCIGELPSSPTTLPSRASGLPGNGLKPQSNGDNF